MKFNPLKYYLIIFFTALLLNLGFSQECEIYNKNFYEGETITYEIYYHWGIIWVSAGEVTFTVKKANYNGKPCYNFKGFGSTYSRYSWIYKVDDQYESWTDITTLKPYRFYRNINEGSEHFYNQYDFDHPNKTAKFSRNKKGYNPIEIPIDYCTMDALTMIYYSRTLNFDMLKLNQTIPINIALDGKAQQTTVKYLGREKIKIKGKGKMNTIKYSPQLIEGSVFNAGDEMTVWVSDDENKVPVQIESGILVGTINAVIKNYKGLKYNLVFKK